jgi:hypothetical protein
LSSRRSGSFEPPKFEDHYEAELKQLLEKKHKGPPVTAAKKSASTNVVNLMDALNASIEGGGKSQPARPPRKSRNQDARPIEPAFATSIDKVPQGERWIHEGKNEGSTQTRGTAAELRHTASQRPAKTCRISIHRRIPQAHSREFRAKRP